MIPDEAALRAFLARILGWSSGERAQAVEQALRSIQLAVTYRTVLVLLGDPYLVSIAQAIHRLTVGAGPFVMCNPLRRTTDASARMPMSRANGVDALRAAVGGSLCLHETRMPRDLALLAAMSRDPAVPVQIIVLARGSYELHPFLFRPSPIWIPPLATRVHEIPRIIDAYATDAIEELSAQPTGFTASDRAWVYGRSASTLPEIEKGTRRLVALRQAGKVSLAARRLGMSNVALTRWLKRRGGRPGKKGS